jgi:hypothetical protein
MTIDDFTYRAGAVAAVPEPGTFAFCLAAAFAALVCRRTLQNQAPAGPRRRNSFSGQLFTLYL